MSHRYSAALVLCLIAAADDDVPLRIGSDLQLFVDDYLIGSMRNVELKLQQPQPAGRAIAFDQPWEGNTSAYVTVFQDSDRFRMYYRGSSDPAYVRASALKPGETVVPKHDQVTCYAESPDGILWTKPSFDLCEFNGSKANNIIWRAEGSHNFSPFKDGNPAAPASERYKAVGGEGRLFAFKSTDGIHWQKMRDEPILTDGAFDSLNVTFWDSPHQEYVAIYRDFVFGTRTLKRATSKDFLHWTPGEWADFGHAPLEQLYTNAATPYFRAPRIFLAFPKRYVPWRKVYDDVPEGGVSEAVFMTSRDGLHWRRRFLEAFIRPGRDRRDWVHRNRMVATGVVPTGPGDVSIYVSRHYNFPSAFIERMTLRTDGFVSLHAGYEGGEMITKPIVIEGNNMVMNYSASAAGSILYEIQDVNGNALPGYGLEQTTPLVGDKMEEVVRLQNRGRKPGRGLEARPVRLRLVLRDADLYSIQIRE